MIGDAQDLILAWLHDPPDKALDIRGPVRRRRIRASGTFLTPLQKKHRFNSPIQDLYATVTPEAVFPFRGVDDSIGFTVREETHLTPDVLFREESPPVRRRSSNRMGIIKSTRVRRARQLRPHDASPIASMGFGVPLMLSGNFVTSPEEQHHHSHSNR